MAKNNNYFVCTSCGYETVKWMGKCPTCQEWNTFEEVTEVKNAKTEKVREMKLDAVEDINYSESSRISRRAFRNGQGFRRRDCFWFSYFGRR
jgi:DNA repair protein RadA/Sms